MVKRIVSSVLIVCLFSPLTLAQSAAPTAATPNAQQPAATSTPSAPKPAMQGFGLEDGTPIKLRSARTISSGDAHTRDTPHFELLEDVLVGGALVVPKGGSEWGTVTEAELKRRMGRGGKLNVNIDSVRLTDGEKIALRAIKDTKGGGDVGAMTGAMVATSIVFFPAAPLFLFMHGKDITIPKGTEITAYINGDTRLDQAKFQGGKPDSAAALTAALIDVASTPPGADIEIDGKFVGNTPSSVNVSQGDTEVAVTKNGFAVWDRRVTVSSGPININSELEAEAN